MFVQSWRLRDEGLSGVEEGHQVDIWNQDGDVQEVRD